MEYKQIQVEPLSPIVGAEIRGVDPREPLADTVLAEIRCAFGEYGVVFFRDQRLTPEQHIAFLLSASDQSTSTASSPRFLVIPLSPRCARNRSNSAI